MHIVLYSAVLRRTALSQVLVYIYIGTIPTTTVLRVCVKGISELEFFSPIFELIELYSQ